MSGIYVKSVVPKSPAAQCLKLKTGDRILAVNGVSLVGMEYSMWVLRHRSASAGSPPSVTGCLPLVVLSLCFHVSGRELIRSSGDFLRLLVAKIDSKTSNGSTKCWMKNELVDDQYFSQDGSRNQRKTHFLLFYLRLTVERSHWERRPHRDNQPKQQDWLFLLKPKLADDGKDAF